MSTMTTTIGTLHLHRRPITTHLHRHNNHNQPPITSLSSPTTTPKLSFPPLKTPYKPPLKPYSSKPLHLTFATLNPNFPQNPPQKTHLFTKITPHHLETLQYIHDNVVCTVGPLFFASLSTISNPIGPWKDTLAKWVEFFGPLKATLWAFLGALMAKAHEFIGNNPSGVLKTQPLWPAIASGLAKWLDIYSGVLMVRILLSWFPNMPWERQPFSAIRHLCDPFLSLFRSIVPPVFGNLDVSPLLAFAVLGTLGSLLGNSQVGPL